MQEYLDDHKGIPYEEQTPQQRWASVCKKVRKKKNWVRRPLAEHFGVVTSTVTFWEQATSYPKNESIYKMAKLIGVTPDELINHLNNTNQIKTTPQIAIKSVSKLIESAKHLSEEELGDVINNLVKMLITKKSDEQGGQLSLGI
jgi:transcriptional regulator with XRE-family HTH domain